MGELKTCMSQLLKYSKMLDIFNEVIIDFVMKFSRFIFAFAVYFYCIVRTSFVLLSYWRLCFIYMNADVAGAYVFM